MTPNARVRRRALRPPPRVRPTLPLHYRPLVLKIIRFLEQPEPIRVMRAVHLDSLNQPEETPTAPGGDQR